MALEIENGAAPCTALPPKLDEQQLASSQGDTHSDRPTTPTYSNSNSSLLLFPAFSPGSSSSGESWADEMDLADQAKRLARQAQAAASQSGLTPPLSAYPSTVSSSEEATPPFTSKRSPTTHIPPATLKGPTFIPAPCTRNGYGGASTSAAAAAGMNSVRQQLYHHRRTNEGPMMVTMPHKQALFLPPRGPMSSSSRYGGGSQSQAFSMVMTANGELKRVDGAISPSLPVAPQALQQQHQRAARTSQPHPHAYPKRNSSMPPSPEGNPLEMSEDTMKHVKSMDGFELNPEELQASQPLHLSYPHSHYHPHHASPGLSTSTCGGSDQPFLPPPMAAYTHTHPHPMPQGSGAGGCCACPYHGRNYALPPQFHHLLPTSHLHRAHFSPPIPMHTSPMANPNAPMHHHHHLSPSMPMPSHPGRTFASAAGGPMDFHSVAMQSVPAHQHPSPIPFNSVSPPPVQPVPAVHQHGITDKERQFAFIVAEYLDQPEINPYGGSVPVERIQNIARLRHGELYTEVVGSRHNSWRAFVNRHPDIFAFFTVDGGGKWKIRLQKHTHWKEADEREAEDRTAAETCLLDCVLSYLREQPDNACQVDQFIKAYPKVNSSEASVEKAAAIKWACPHHPYHRLPPRGDLVRFIRKHQQRLVYNEEDWSIALRESQQGQAMAALNKQHQKTSGTMEGKANTRKKSGKKSSSSGDFVCPDDNENEENLENGFEEHDAEPQQGANEEDLNNDGDVDSSQNE